MSIADALAVFALGATYEAIPAAGRDALKVRVLDSLGCALGALDGEPVRFVRQYVAAMGGSRRCTLIGGGMSAPDRTALYNGALVRYLDFNDSYLAPGETCHPSDNLAAVLAAAEYAEADGRDFLVALAVAYQVQCRLSDAAPVRDRGFDHVTQLAYSVAAGASRALRLTPQQAASAIGICGAAFNALRVTRTGFLSHWKGLAAPNAAAVSLQGVLLARAGITGPREVFEGNKGFMDAIAGRFHIDWSAEDLERVTATVPKAYNAEVHAQPAIEAVLELRERVSLAAQDVEHIDVETFEVAYHIIGGGEEGEKRIVRTKEEADHSLPYLIAVALLDGAVGPEQYRPERIGHPDVQQLLHRVAVRPSPELTRQFPERMPYRVTVRLRDGRVLQAERRDYAGFTTRPWTWDAAAAKFHRLSAPFVGAPLRRRIVDTVAALDRIKVKDLTALLARAGATKRTAATPRRAGERSARRVEP